MNVAPSSWCEPVDEQPLALADAVLLSGNLDDRVGHGFLGRSRRAQAARRNRRMIAATVRERESKSSIHSDIGTYSGALLVRRASTDDDIFVREARRRSRLSAAGLRRFLPPREPRRERLRFGCPSAPTAPSSAASAVCLGLGRVGAGIRRRFARYSDGGEVARRHVDPRRGTAVALVCWNIDVRVRGGRRRAPASCGFAPRVSHGASASSSGSPSGLGDGTRSPEVGSGSSSSMAASTSARLVELVLASSASAGSRPSCSSTHASASLPPPRT